MNKSTIQLPQLLCEWVQYTVFSVVLTYVDCDHMFRLSVAIIIIIIIIIIITAAAGA